MKYEIGKTPKEWLEVPIVFKCPECKASKTCWVELDSIQNKRAGKNRTIIETCLKCIGKKEQYKRETEIVEKKCDSCRKTFRIIRLRADVFDECLECLRKRGIKYSSNFFLERGCYK